MPPKRASYVALEEPDIVLWYLIGHVEEADIKRNYDAQMDFFRGKSHILLLIDVSELKSMTLAARRAAAAGPIPGKKVLPVRGCAVVGASFHIKVVSLLVAKASRVFNPQEDNAIHFCDTEPEARQWIDKRRQDIGVSS
jgi:SpoIIAA-like